MKKHMVCSMICLLAGFLIGKQTIKHEEITRIIQGKTVRDTIIRFIPDTVYLPEELKYKYVYEIDTIFKDVPVVDRDATLAGTVKDWNLTRAYKKTLFDNEHGRFSIDLSVQYNELQKLYYSFTPVQKEITITKKDMFIPFISASMLNSNFSIGCGFFYQHLGCRVEWAPNGINWGIMYKF